jgi:DNA-binding NtrC family response regulator
MSEMEKSRPLIVVIDDDKLILSLVTQILQREYEVMTFASTASAQAAMLDRKPDLTITDLHLPGEQEGGRRLIAWLQERFPDLPIIAVSGGEAGAESETLDVPETVMSLQKPFRAAAVLAAVKNSLGLKQAS